jgi:hypothetical protein
LRLRENIEGKRRPVGLPNVGARFRVDALSAFFRVVVNLGAAGPALAELRMPGRLAVGDILGGRFGIAGTLSQGLRETRQESFSICFQKLVCPRDRRRHQSCVPESRTCASCGIELL